MVTTTTTKKPPEFTMQHASKYLERGFNALMKKDLKDAGACAQLVLKYMPKLSQAHFLVGLIALETEDWKIALSAFGTVVEIDEKHAAAWAQYARVMLKMANYNGAEQALKKAVEYGSNDPLVQNVIGTAYNLLGDQKAAFEWYSKACEKNNSPMFVLNKAKSLVFLGKIDEAREALLKVLSVLPKNAEAHWILSRLEKAKDTNHINDIIKLLEDVDETRQSTAYLYYGLAKEYEDLEMWSDAFKAYEKGAKIKRAHVQYDEKAEIDAFETLQKTFTKEWLENIGEGHDASSPIFIVGQPRTGTTLIERIITARDDVHSAGELQQFGHAVKSTGGARIPGMVSSENVIAAANADPKYLGKFYMEATRSLRGDLPYFVDKLPINYLYVPLIAAALPNAKIIHVKRDPMDACFASYKQLFAEAYFYSYDQGEMARHSIRYQKLMKHYRDIMGDRMIEVAYEDVVDNMEFEARRLIKYLGLEWQDASLEFHKQKTAVTTASATQVREKVHSRSVGKWRRFENELKEMYTIIRNSTI
ncbi:tetratricopeptide repeat-containing sulfotransferase family protein [Pseudemcibacter aquimaris]|uniref:tetratricopeptide repeat-containing sulfotransferase family protein n=1 Tax=Pseudemcibacter aquimaris TaxID=2857064 RepID=UPI002013B69D|nr:sulfotransferase [Pseudemcibacter aquimaris]MCC3862111.1 sulfotransferase [Pseudemcibacter aquimaris]WDU58864.1 sulfotransferase [Pseudemcibacter aquimaris]